ncbi:Similar to Uncharacterized membrane protein YMR155W; acc. no. Q03795 [Pyronema omphalodes CBS 100304]|uniref:Similar to Uncharacterized membrane protein YMR155W acc. no. Q03795 n=1 Tax=Pyronema omphalodes (strain CBS 100304) TaxID=1076935 RepID=U4LM92_PYROM|nr:Similar to Uncharacterized membrane protein YMR155W; acc. no. Q03795 [Pyronema omphalodes CBS 100304]
MPTHEQKLHIARVVSLIASTLISLAAGTNLAERLNLSATESNMIWDAHRQQRTQAVVDYRRRNAILWILPNAPRSMVNGEGYLEVWSLCFFALLTGIGSCCGFGAALKMAAVNWPKHRGTATAIPLAAFGLSAFVFSSLSSWLFPGNTESFLLVLAVATSSIVLLLFPFCRQVPVSTGYGSVPSSDPDEDGLYRTKSNENHSGRFDDDEPGTSTPRQDPRHSRSPSSPIPNDEPRPRSPNERTSLFSRSSTNEDSSTHDKLAQRTGRGRRDSSGAILDGCSDLVHRLDIRGWELMKSIDFWLLFIMIGALTGVGLMTINNIGHNAQVLWSEYDPTKSPEYVQKRQGMHVSILSIGSFTGRMVSGISSDLLLRLYNLPRLYLILLSSFLFFIAVLLAILITSPLYLFWVSSLNGLAYGMLFGVSPTIVSEAFGVNGLSTNWGAMTISCVIAGNVLNLLYGRVFDGNSQLGEEGRKVCLKGNGCYRGAYWGALVVTGLGAMVAVVMLGRMRRLQELGVRRRSVG